jgi:dynein heavy chain
MYLNEQPEVPFETLNYLIAEINYGGRVTDDKDVRLITALLKKYFNPDVMKPSYEFAPGGVYISPQELGLAQIREMVSRLPGEDDP